MATDHPVFALPAELTSRLLALRTARDTLTGAELRHLLAASTLAVQERDLAAVAPDARVRAELAGEREQIAFHEARAILIAIVDMVLDVAEPFLPANDAADDSSSEAAE